MVDNNKARKVWTNIYKQKGNLINTHLTHHCPNSILIRALNLLSSNNKIRQESNLCYIAPDVIIQMLKTIQRTRLPVWAKQRLPATQTRLTVCTSSASTAMSTSANAATTSCMSNPCPPFPTRATVEVDPAPLMTWESHQKKRSTIDPSKRWR